MEVGKIAKSDDTRINDEITASSCRLIGVDGSQVGLFAIRDAQRVADDQGLDLVEIAPNAEPPVCKVMDYGKFKYQQAMKAKAARKNQSKVEVKEMKFRPKIDVGDYETKKGHVLRFLKKGARVKITIMFRGREITHPELGKRILDRVAAEVEDFGVVEQHPNLEGKNMTMLLGPSKAVLNGTIDKVLEEKARAALIEAQEAAALDGGDGGDSEGDAATAAPEPVAEPVPAGSADGEVAQ